MVGYGPGHAPLDVPRPGRAVLPFLVLCAAALSLLSILGTVFLLPAVPPHPEGIMPATVLEEMEAPVAPGGKRLRLFDWGTYLQYFRRPVLSGLLAEFFLFAFAFATFTAGFALFAERRFTWNGHPFTPREIGFVLVYVGGLGIILQGGLIGRLARRFGEPSLVSAGQNCERSVPIRRHFSTIRGPACSTTTCLMSSVFSHLLF